jgi:Holliday junction resolvasome RuvABC ATP-dependent DNA helicase subunit
MDIFDLLGITQLLEWGKEVIGIDKPQYIQQPLPQKFMYRPETFDEYISQEKAKDKAKLTIELINKGFPRHFLLMGSAGYGKTTLAGIIAKTLGYNFNVYVGSNFDIDTMNDFLVKQQDSKLPNVLLIDEIAECKKDVLTYMLPIIEDFKLNGLNLRKFILIGATTDTYILSKRCQPFLDRIHCKINLEDYNTEDIKKLLKQYNNQIHQANVKEEDYDIISKNVRYTPRLAISMFDYFIATNGDLDRVLKMNRIIKDGLDDVDIRILKHLNDTNGKAVGEEALAIIGNMTRAEYKELREPYILRRGLISRGSRGRMLTGTGKLFLQEVIK